MKNKKDKKGGSNPNGSNPNGSNPNENKKESTNNIPPNVINSSEVAIQPGFYSLFNLLSLMGPFLLISFFVLLSFFNQNMKGFIYFIGVCFLILTSKIFSGILYPILKDDDYKKVSCRLLPIPFLDGILPFSSLVYGFTFSYLFFPMFSNNIINIPILLTILLLSAADSIIKLNQKCAPAIGLLFALFIGLITGMFYIFMVDKINNQMLYHTDYVSNKLACSMPSEQKFQCKVYKNGELISTMTK